MWGLSNLLFIFYKCEMHVENDFYGTLWPGDDMLTDWYLRPECDCNSFSVCVCVCLTQAQEACGPLEIDNALTVVRGLERDMQEAKASAAEGKLRPLPGETVSQRTHRVCLSTGIHMQSKFEHTCGQHVSCTPANSLSPVNRECPEWAQLETRPRSF